MSGEEIVHYVARGETERLQTSVKLAARGPKARVLSTREFEIARFQPRAAYTIFHKKNIENGKRL